MSPRCYLSVCGGALPPAPSIILSLHPFGARGSLGARDEHGNASPRWELQSSSPGLSAPRTDGLTALRERMGSAQWGRKSALMAPLPRARRGQTADPGAQGGPEGRAGRPRLGPGSARQRRGGGRGGGEGKSPGSPAPSPRAGTPP